MKKKMFKLISVLLVAMLLLSACSTSGGDATETVAANPEQGNSAESPPAGGNNAPASDKPEIDVVMPVPELVSELSDETLTVAVESEPRTLAGFFSGEPGTAAQQIGMCLTDPLTHYNSQTGEVEMTGTLSGFERIDDYRVRCFLREGLISYGGNVITANDLVEATKLVLQINEGGTTHVMIDPEKVYVEDEFTFVLGTYDIYPTFTDLFTQGDWIPAICMAEVNALGGADAVHTNPNVGCGKYYLDEWVPGQYVQLVRNDNYWDQDNLPYYKYLKCVFINDSATRALALQAGDVDLIFGISGTQIEGLGNIPGLYVEAAPTINTISVFMNTSKAPFNDENFRKAVRMLIDYEGLIQLATNGRALTAQTSFSRANIYYLKDYKNFPDGGPFIDDAKALLAQTSYNGEALDILCEQLQEEEVQYFQACMLAGGININISVTDSLPAIMGSGEYDMIYQPVYGTNAARVLNRYDGRVPPNEASGGAQYRDDPVFEAIIDIARYDNDDAARLKAYQEVQQYVIDKCIMIGLYCTVIFNAHNDNIRVAQHTPAGAAEMWSVAPVA